MTNSINFRQLKPGEEIEVCNLAARSFNEFIAPGFTEEGIQEFFKYSNPRAFKRRLESGYFTMVAESGGKLAGMIEMRGNKHISMLYVDKAYHRKGVAKDLVRQALQEISSNSATPKDITVNSSRYAVPFYEGLGFIQFENEKSIFGVIHIPMVLSLSNIKQLAK
ncbi:MAG: GNAT family N-acetyltransferase [Candidatus Dadabacteria bacterium]|nr:GNAT family N-acetyltransferase [Candidatus Dadabacteria bacterium]